MSMHLRGSRDMMGQDEQGWWKSRTGLEQKLIIFSTLLFIVAFSLTITVIVLKNRKPDCGGGTTLAPTGSTSSDQPPTGSTSSDQPPTSSELPKSSSELPTTSEVLSSSSSEAPSSSPLPETTPTKPEPPTGG